MTDAPGAPARPAGPDPAPDRARPPSPSHAASAPAGVAPAAGTALIPVGRPPNEAVAPAEDAPLGESPATVAAWFDDVADATQPENDGTLTAARESARAWSRRAKADNTREAYRWAVRAWCAWCDTHGLYPLPATGADVAAFLAAERAQGLRPNTHDLRRAAIRYLHHAAGCPSPTEDVLVGETLAGIRRAAPNPA